MLKCLAVGIGGFIGSVIRHLLSLAFAGAAQGLPVGTLFINIAGSFVIGAVSEAFIKTGNTNATLLAFLTTGVCGGFTTFSAFSLETVRLFENGRIFLGGMYAALSLFGCLLAVVIGRLIVGKLLFA